MLWDWFIQNGGNFDDITQFCEITGCHYDTTKRLITSMCCDTTNKSFRECAIDYISRFDIIITLMTRRMRCCMSCAGLSWWGRI